MIERIQLGLGLVCLRIKRRNPKLTAMVDEDTVVHAVADELRCEPDSFAIKQERLPYDRANRGRKRGLVVSRLTTLARYADKHNRA